MEEAKINTYYVSEKISKVRWIPEEMKECDRFVTGSWNMSTNHVRVWRLFQNQYAEDINDSYPKCADKVVFKRDITGLELLSKDTFVVGCADGHLSILKHHQGVEEDTLNVKERSSLLHKFNATEEPAPLTAISIYGYDIATVGEDGRLNIVDGHVLNSVRTSIEADSVSLLAVAYNNPQEVLTANRMGVIRLFDIRANEDNRAVESFMASCEDDKRANYVSSICSHPTQSHIVLAGSEEGSITVWDLRQPGYPASYLSAHSGAINEINFHPKDSMKLFTAADCGELWLWTQQPVVNTMPVGLDKTISSESMNPWLSGERAKNRIKVTSLISDLRKPINSLDAHSSNVICGGDSEAIYLISNL